MQEWLGVTRMDMERINEDLIKVSINAEDLESRGINFLDLVSGQEHIESFFYSILEEVDEDRHFRESEAVTFQVMPKQDGLELYISRNNFEDQEEFWAEELSKHFLKGKQRDKVEKESETEAITENQDSLSFEEYVEQVFEQAEADKQSELGQEDLIIRFNSLDDFLAMTKDVDPKALTANLYYLKDCYFLALREVDADLSDKLLKAMVLKMLNFGREVGLSEAYLMEHGRLIRSEDAVQFFKANF